MRMNNRNNNINNNMGNNGMPFTHHSSRMTIAFGDKISTVYIEQTEPEFKMPDQDLICPQCGTTIHQLMHGRRTGCVMCYNVFAEKINKILRRTQPADAYVGRASGDSGKPILFEEEKEEEKSVVNDEKARPNTKDADAKYEEIKNADITTLSDNAIKIGMKLAAQNKDYILANEFKKELDRREGDKGNE